VDAFQRRRRYMKPLTRSFIKMAPSSCSRSQWPMAARQKSPSAKPSPKQFSSRGACDRCEGQQMVGVLLPPSIPGALVNWAAMLQGKVPINLNYTTSNESLASCAKQCDSKCGRHFKLFLEKVHIEPPGKVIYVEDLAEKPRLSEKLIALLSAKLLSRPIARNARSASPESLRSTTPPRSFFPVAPQGNPRG